jgi:predicted GIY-YIG superfamily endonuclease
MHGLGKRFVYVLRSDNDPKRHYVGVTSDSRIASNGTTTSAR